MATADDTVIAEIARLMEDAGQSRSQYVRIADRAARLYAPVVHTLAALAFVGWMIAGAGWHQSLVIAIAVLIITCPCAMGLAVPAAQVVASGALIRRGLLVKDGSALERLAEVDVAVFDKTGTLTLGEPQAELDTVPLRALPIALALAQASRHPLSRSIANALVAKGIAPARLDGVREVAGDGVFATQASEAVALRRPQTDAAQMAVELVIGDECWPVRFDDRLRSDAGKAIDRLHAMGIDSRILSGDRNAPLAKVADAGLVQDRRSPEEAAAGATMAASSSQGMVKE